MNLNVRRKVVLKKWIIFISLLLMIIGTTIQPVYAYVENENSIKLNKDKCYSNISLSKSNKAIIISSIKNNIIPKFTQEEVILDRNIKGTILLIISSQLTVVLVILNTVRKVKKDNKER